MKQVGLVGGTTWLSTQTYYRYMNEMVQERTEKKEFADCIIASINFAEIVRNNAAGNQNANRDLIVRTAKQLAAAGVHAIALGANTMHLYADDVKQATGLPFIHGIDPTVAAIHAAGIKKIALIGTRFTMEASFYPDRLTPLGIELLIPDEEDKCTVHNPIFNEFAREEFNDETRAAFLKVILKLQAKGAEGVILGCTEYPFLIKPEHVTIPLFDMATCHCEAIVDFMLS